MGGAILPNKVIIKEAKPGELPSVVDQILKEAVFMTSTPILQEFVAGVTDMIPNSQPAYDTYTAFFHRRDETELHDSLKKDVTGRGARHDKPRVAKAVFETLKYHPELAHSYLKGTYRSKTI